MRKSLSFNIESFSKLEPTLIQWAAQFKNVCILNSNSSTNQGAEKFRYASFDLLIAVGDVAELSESSGNSFEYLKEFYALNQDWLFGYLSYDLKNESEKLNSDNEDRILFPDIHFFRPRYVFVIKGNVLNIEYLGDYDTESEIYSMMENIRTFKSYQNKAGKSKALIRAKVEKEAYLKNVSLIKKHIQRGDIYELNYCVEFFAENSLLHPVSVYEALNRISQTPFSCFYRTQNNYLMSASPERFLKKEGSKLISQPIKGTRKRGVNAEEDNALKQALAIDKKEQSENVMIVDLVRNDLSRSAQLGSVEVEELFGVYSFKQVHQLISTISCQLNPDVHFIDALKNAFPMGSMTGAPKVRAMQLIETFESTKRGLYSGAVGYISPEGNFDFNVVIRSILYNASKHYVSFMVGSAITANSDAQKEYEECLLKADAMFQVLKSKGFE
jgi:para-aminobenzoate synthetase component 1